MNIKTHNDELYNKVVENRKRLNMWNRKDQLADDMYRCSDQPPKLRKPIYDDRYNCLYYETLTKKYRIVQHWQKFDKLNRLLEYRDSYGAISAYIYYGETNDIYAKYIKNDDEDEQWQYYDRKGRLYREIIYTRTRTYVKDYDTRRKNYMNNYTIMDINPVSPYKYCTI